MQEFTIHKETPPTRCEICHKSDLFDQKTGKCGRCENVLIPEEKPTVINFQQRNTTQVYSIHLVAGGVAAFFSFLAFIPGFFFPFISPFLGAFGLITGIQFLSYIRLREGARSGEVLAYIGVYCGFLAIILGIFRYLFALI